MHVVIHKNRGKYFKDFLFSGENRYTRFKPDAHVFRDYDDAEDAITRICNIEGCEPNEFRIVHR